MKTFRTSAQMSETNFTDETVEQFLARGGAIQKCPPRAASGVPPSSMVYVDGQGIPISSSPSEYVPAFVRDLPTYDLAQDERATPTDDGTEAIWKEYEQSSVPAAIRPQYERNASIMLGEE